ncbi:Type 1 glutamine amidotransferase-like domain-containing protein [Thomasclavelia sp.]
MKKMLLVSMFQNVAKLLKMVEPDLKNKTITYIPTASKVEKLGFFINIGKWKLKKLGLIVDELDISSASYETIVYKLTKNDYIYIAGGNTFFLLQELKRTCADKVIIQEINKGKLYIGESAGAIIITPDIGYSAEMDDPAKASDLKDYIGLNLIDFYIVPHFNNWEMGKSAKKIINMYSDNLDLKIINDNQAIFINDGEVKILTR